MFVKEKTLLKVYQNEIMNMLSTPIARIETHLFEGNREMVAGTNWFYPNILI